MRLCEWRVAYDGGTNDKVVNEIYFYRGAIPPPQFLGSRFLIANRVVVKKCESFSLELRSNSSMMPI